MEIQKQTRSSSPGVRSRKDQLPATAPASSSAASEAPTGHAGPMLALGVFCCVVVVVLVRHWQVPAVVPASAPLSAGFSADRTRDVLSDLGECGVKYIGSPANEVCAVDVVHRHVRLAITGQEGRVKISNQSASGHFYLDFLGGLTNVYRNLTNVIVRVQGRSRTAGCALLISSHFDSNLGSPAASDANAEIAIMIELLKLFANDPPPVDVIFNFNGGEEFLMPAAHGFITSHPWANEICAVVNLESGGSGGRELLFQYGPQNRWIAETYAKTAPRPFASSITQVLFQTGIIPGDTDYRVYRDFGGIPGADFVVIANGWVYHTSRDDFAHLDFRSIQRYGTTAAAFARGLADKLTGGRPSGAEAAEAAILFDVAGAFVVVYSAEFAKAMHIACSILCLSWSLGVHRGLSHVRSILAITLTLLAAFIGGTLCSVLCGMFLAFSPSALAGAGHPELSQLLFVPPAFTGFFLVIHWKQAKRTWSEAEAGAGAMSLAAFFCLCLSTSSVGVLASYPFLLWAICPLLGEAVSQAMPACLCTLLAVASFILPWVIHMQLYVLTLDMFCPLTTRSGTTVPGDVVQAAICGAIPGLCMAFSCRWLLKLRSETLKMVLGVAFLTGVALAAFTFPYSYDRPKRIYMQHVQRSMANWDLSQSEPTVRNR